MQGETILIFNGHCGMCRTLANQINSISMKKISVVPLGSREAEDLLHEFYPNGHPFSYFLIERRNGKAETHAGFGAIMKLARLLPLGGSIRAPYTFMHYKAHGTLTSERMLMTNQSKTINKQRVSSPDRRSFIRVMIAGAAGMAVAGVGMGSGGLFQQRVAEAAAKQSVNGQLPKSFVVSVPHLPNNPDCGLFGCSCGSDTWCYFCTTLNNVTGCYKCCQLVPSCNFECYTPPVNYDCSGECAPLP